MWKIAVDWEEFLTAQKKLDQHIFDLKGLNYLKTNQDRILALVVELYELVNETKVFKFWSSSIPDKSKLLMEYVDIFHFTLSLAATYDVSLDGIEYVESKELEKKEICDFFLDITNNLQNLMKKKNFLIWFKKFLEIGTNLGITFSELKDFYFKKNEINFERQKNNY